MVRATRAVAVLLAAGGIAAWTRRRWRDWGSTADERARTWPGEGTVPPPTTAQTMAVSIAAPPEEVWRWLVQIGQGRGGMYSYERLENLFGLDIRNAEGLREDWQHLAPGDRVVVVPPGRLRMPDGYSFPVAEVEPPHHIVLRQAPPEHPWNAVWTFVVEADGHGGSRLVSRSCAQRQAGAAGRAAAVASLIMEPVIVAMTRRMLLGIRERAERSTRAHVPVGPPPHAAPPGVPVPHEVPRVP
jgi:uncharacterized protein YndB with AHSA1/START domain